MVAIWKLKFEYKAAPSLSGNLIAPLRELPRVTDIYILPYELFRHYNDVLRCSEDITELLEVH